MIFRIIVPIVLAIVLCDMYVDLHLLRHSKRWPRLKRALWWAQCAVMLVLSVSMAVSRDFAPSSLAMFNVYLFLLGAWIVPKFVFTVCSLLGWGHCWYHKTKTNWGNYAGIALGLALTAVTVWGCTLGFSRIKVRHITYVSPSLPAAFDGYRVLQFSDAHVGTYGKTRRYILQTAVDSILRQDADLVVFTGDIQNMRPDEVEKVVPILSRIKAKDGVITILGNHDYADYVQADASTKRAYEQQTRSLQTDMGWRMLLNENVKVRRGADSIVIAGMENDGNPPFPQRGDVRKTMQGVGNGAFTLMLQHDPTAWRRKILPQCDAQLTLSGHTHAMQFEVFGWSPSSLVYREWGGVFHEGQRAINVSTGLGGFVPFRFGVDGEVVVITLKKG